MSDIESSAGRSPASRGTDSVSADLDPPHPAVDLDGRVWQGDALPHEADSVRRVWELPQIHRKGSRHGRLRLLTQ